MEIIPRNYILNIVKYRKMDFLLRFFAYHSNQQNLKSTEVLFQQVYTNRPLYAI